MNAQTLPSRLARTSSLALLLLAPLALAVSMPDESMPDEGQPSRPQEPLSADHDAGRVLDREGVASRKAVMADRWGPADARTAIEPGDWLKTGTRGANALAARLAGGAELLLGPGALVEVVDGSRVRLVRGELRIQVDEDSSLEVSGPGDEAIGVSSRVVLRARDGGLFRLPEDPAWLTGYEQNTSTEAMGSLLANIDGRNVPLTLGYHKVTVDIRDQIARTVIEESFINHTPSILEGIFYFPLPADASISGFGMWIGDELVQGDIVEKQRAREIYETILRERRDPGLLEWTGGNIFKARVFPIGAEKRIRISYSQVLPKQGDTYSYHYALQSELLRLTPLRQLQIEVNVSSAETLESVSCPSHECRVRTTEHAAKVEFEAEQYSPDSDFELRVRTHTRAGTLTAIPHRRGDDGYFMLLLDGPQPDDQGIAPESEPLDVLVLADTSGSMWGPARETQIAFVEALLGALGERDTFNLMTCDSHRRWVFERSQPNDTRGRDAALAFLEAREPLGWSDLDAAFAAAIGVAGPRTHVVYVGDGQPTAGDADPVAVAHRLQRAYRGSGTFHAVVPGNRSEPVVLRAVAGLGGGSVRTIGGGSDPAATAFDLLRDVTSPAVKDLSLEFDGLSVAAVYPEVLPNLTLGSQQVIVGRFDPSLGEASGQVTVMGTLGGERVRLTTELALSGEDRGNSFIPRLWARSHLDHLLDQGSSAEIRERVIALSEDFQVITPYTSFLVLESDADRERFQVERNFRMRDGEEFFAQGRDDARHQLVREQMKLAKTWRARLRAQMLAELSGMNRELTELLRGGGPRFGQSAALGLAGEVAAFSGLRRDAAMSHSRRSPGAYDAFREQERFGDRSEIDTEWQVGQEGEDELEFDEDDQLAWNTPMPAEEAMPASEPPARSRRKNSQLAAKAPMGYASGKGRVLSSEQNGLLVQDGRFWYGGGEGTLAQGWDAFGQLFPALGPIRADDPEWSWPQEVLAILRGLDRRAVISGADHGWRIAVESTYRDAHGRSQKSAGTHLLGADRWLQIGAHAPGHVYQIQWLADGERGNLNVGWNLGRVRESQDGDGSGWPGPFSWYFGDQLRYYAGYEARVEPGARGRVRVVLHQEQTPNTWFVLEIDRKRGALIEQRFEVDGEVTQKLSFSGFQEVGGAWWPGMITTWNKGRVDTTTTRIRVEKLDPDALTAAIGAALVVRSDAILLGEEVADAAAAKQAVEDGEATLEERWFLLRLYARSQRWEQAQPHLDAFTGLAGERLGLLPIHLTYLQQSRRNEELRVLLGVTGRDLAARPRDAEYGLATHLLNFTGSLNQGNELLEFLRALEPVFARQEHILDARLVWDQRALQALSNTGRPSESFALLERMVADYPYQTGVLTQYANALAQRGEVDAALAFLAEAEAENGPWQPYEVSQLRRTGAQIQWNAYRLEDFVATVETWEREDPGSVDSGMYNQYLSALIFLDREDDAWGRAEAWLTSYRRPTLEPFELARLQAAVQVTLGNGYNLYNTRYDDDRAALLADTARYLAHEEELGHGYLTGQILGHYRFRETDAVQALLGDLYRELDSDLTELPAQRVANFVSWLRNAGYATDAGEDAWQTILERVLERWTASQDEGERSLLGQVVLSFGRHGLVVRMHRAIYERSPEGAERATAAQALFFSLMGGSWSAEVQAELVSLLPALAVVDDERPEIELHIRILALYDLTTWLPMARAQAAVAALPEVNSMPRRTLAAKRDEALRAARSATSELLAGLAASLQPEELRVWAEIERVYLQVKTRSDLREAHTRSMEILSNLAAAYVGAEVEEDVPVRDRILTARCAATVAHLLAHFDGETRAELEGPFLTMLEEGIESGTVLLAWRELVYALLVATDRGDEVEAALREWYGGGEEFARVRWGRDYAHILAERGGLERAAEVLEEVERIDELTHEDYRSLSDWYTALDRQDASREARVSSWQMLDEYAIGQALSAESGAYQRRGEEVPPELDPEIPVRFVALMRKATHPANWCWVLQSYYGPTQDFRLLECMPEALLGHSAQAIYPFLSNIGGVASMIHEEATVDRVRAHLAQLRESRAQTDVDRRALSLLEFTIVRRATSQANGTEEQAEVALRALREAGKGEWAEGEPAMMAALLANQGALQPRALAGEQLRQLRALSRSVEHPRDRFVVTGHLASTLWAYGLQDDAIRTLQAALDAFRSQSDGRRLPQEANGQLTTLSGWLQAVGAYRVAERLWLDEIAAGHHRQQTLWLEQSLFGLYRDAVLARAEISLGRDLELYRAVHVRFLSALEARSNENHAYQLIVTLCDLWKRADSQLHYRPVRRDVASFAFSGLPGVLRQYQYRNGQNMVGTVADCLTEVRDARTTLEFLVVRAESEPSWLRLANQDFWAQHAWRFATAGHNAGPLEAALEERALAIVLRELREDLRTREARNRSVYDRRHGTFWAEKRAVFRRAALAFLEERRDNGPAIAYAAEYLFRGLEAYDEAIDALARGHRRGVLAIEGRALLAGFLQERGRWSESVAILDELVADRPGEVSYRVMLMRGHFNLGDEPQLSRTFDSAVAWFQETDAWNEWPIAALAAGCLETHLFEDCVALYDEAIALHVKSARRRGVGDGTLSTYYRNLAGAHSGLGDTDSAVDAAAGAIVSWGRGRYERQQDLARLEQILFDAEDLDAYVERLDEESRRTGLENPIVRKALGRAYVRREAYERAVAQLRRALEGQPNDLETHAQLVQTCEAMGRADLTVAAQLEWARTAGHELHLYRDLGRRLMSLRRPDDAERAYTHIVEIMPNESESHTALAEIRQHQGRWSEASDHWRHVIRVRTKEPAGYVGLARTLIRQRHWTEAQEVIDQVISTSWPERFGDVRSTGRRLLREIPRSR